MKIIVAKTAGFCMGVKRAVDLAIDCSSSQPGNIFTLGPLIHNNQTIEMLRERGVVTIDEKTVLPEKSTILIRAHGVPPQTQQAFATQGHTIIDGTCPKVKTVHKVIEKYREAGYSIIITGDTGHAEVIGLQGYAGSNAYLISKPSDVLALPPLSKICLVSQTTFDGETFDAIARAVKSLFVNSTVAIKKTICAATNLRQSETKELASQVEALIVVGGKNSANTKRLVSISEQCGTHTQAVETESEIDWKKIAQCKSIGITAGASTPGWMIKRVVDYCTYMDQQGRKSLINLVLIIFDKSANFNIFAALGAVSLYYLSCVFQEFTFAPMGAAIAFLYFLSVYLWNSLASIESTAHLGLSRYQSYRNHRRLLFVLTVVGMSIQLILSYFVGKPLFFLMLFATVVGAIYHVTIVPRPLRRFLHYHTLKDIPTSRDLFVALAWSTVLTFLPQATSGIFRLDWASLFCFVWIFLLAYFRSLIFDLRDIEGDRIMGRETLVTIAGENSVRKGIQFLLAVLAVLFVAYPFILTTDKIFLTGTEHVRFLTQIVPLIYIAAFLQLNRKIAHNRSSIFSLLADAMFFLAGFCVFVFGRIIK